MNVENAITPNPTQMAGFSDGADHGPIYMLNLLKYRERAEYADGRKSGLSGREAYSLYTDGVSELLKEFGGSLTFKASVERMTIGEVEELWDDVAIAMYPSRAAMMQMMQSETMRDIGAHRAAGLAGQLNIECVGALGSWL
ncbi:MAG: DUF1330 domain-containing protein [Pseudomonadaceae bacterium]|nr:DUF1330 domain-containing protein [Pseudomonadaceae bacterium]